MEVSLQHSEVDKRADELARLYLLRERVATRHANARAKLKKQHDEELAAMDERMEKLANAVRNQREDQDAQLSMPFVVTVGDPDELAETIEAEGETEPASAETDEPPAETLADSIERDRKAGQVASSNAEANGTFVDQLREQDGKPAKAKKRKKSRKSEAAA